MPRLAVKTLLSILFLIAGTTVQAQYADRGTGKLKPYIWFFDWNGFTVADGATRMFTTADGIRVTIRFSNVSGTLEPDVMNTWYGAVLHNLYEFSDTRMRPSLHSRQTAATVMFDMEITARRNGVSIPFTLVAADAEASVSTEVTHFTTSGGAWQAVDYFKNVLTMLNPLTGCNTQTIQIANTYGGSSGTGENMMMATWSDGVAPLVVKTTLERQSGAIGGMAVTFGILAPIDWGDLPGPYPSAQHAINWRAVNGCSFAPPGPSLIPESRLFLGNVMADPDDVQGADDNLLGADEEAVSVFPAYNGSTGTYALNVAVTNQTGATAYAGGWMDWDRDGVFSANETIVLTIPPGATSAVFSWTGLPYSLADGPSARCAFRFRIASTRAAVESPEGFAADGEVEDYMESIPQTCNITKVDAGRDVAICEGRNARLQASGADRYQWQPDPSLTAVNIPNPSANPPATTAYFLYGEHANGCHSRDTVTVRVHPLPVLNVTPGNYAVCQGTSITFTATGADNVTWSDYTGAGVGTGNTLTVAPQISGPYTAVLSENLCGQRATITLPVMVTPRPVVSVTPLNATICEGSAVTFTATGGSFTWTDAQQNIIGTAGQLQVQPANSANYAVRVQHAVCGIDETFVLPVTVRKPTDMGVSPLQGFACKGEQVQFTARGADEAVWEREDFTVIGTGDRLTTAPVTSSTVYHVTLRDRVCGQEQRVTLPVSMRQPPDVTISKSNDIDCMHGAATLTAAGALEYRWSAGPGISDPAMHVQSVSPVTSHKYYLSSKDIYGCSALDSVTVAVSYTGQRPHFQLPNAFTPNRDGVNDCFGIKSTGPVTRFELSVFDRWGKIVFRTSKANDCWDGTYKNVPLDVGTFVYVLRIASECGPVERKGTVTLLR